MMIGDYAKRIQEIAADLANIEVEIAENELCPKLKKTKVELLQALLDNTRPALVLCASELRRYRRPCEDCVRCDESAKESV